MPNKPIIDIDVNDEKFKAFYELFQKYQSSLGSMPDDWKKVNDATSESGKAAAAAAGVLVESMAHASEHAKAITGHLKSASEAQKQFQSATRQSESALKKTVHQAEKLGKSIFGIGKFMFKTAAWGTGLFAGATFGMDKLAGAAVGNQRTARGLGMTTGQYRAFGTDMGRYVDTALLSKVAGEQSSYTGRVMLARASGMSESQVATANPGDVAVQLAMKAHEWWKNTPASMRTSEQLQATGFPQSGLNIEDMKRLGSASSQELMRARSQYQQDSKSLDITSKTTDAFYVFRRQLGLAGQKLETALTNKLSGLAGPLGSFITNLEKDAEILIGGVLTPSNLKAIESGMKSFATYLGSPDFKLSVAAFVDGMKKMFHIVEKAKDAAHDVAKAKQRASDNFFSSLFGSNPITLGIEKGLAAGSRLRDFRVSTSNALNKPENAALFAAAGKKYGLPQNLLEATALVESSGDPMKRSGKDAKGILQLMPATAKALGVKDPYNIAQSAEGGAKLYDQLIKRYHGDYFKAIAAYNWNPNSVDKDIKAHGAAWLRYTPKETQGEVSKVSALMAAMKARPHITITNKTGSNIAVSANAAAK